MKKLILLLLTLFLFQKASIAQKNRQALIDSLLLKLPNMAEDTPKVNLLNNLSSTYNSIKPDEGIKYGMEGLRLSEKINFKNGIAKLSQTIATNYFSIANYTQALEYYSTSLKNYEELNNKTGILDILHGIGNIYGAQSNYPKALEFFFKTLKISEQIDDKKGQAAMLCNIGHIYALLLDYSKALEYSFKALHKDEELGDKNGVAYDLGNLGIIYEEQADYSKAIEYETKALTIYEEIGNKFGMARNIANIGNLYKNKALYSKALEYDFRALKLFRELGYKVGTAVILGNIGSLYLSVIKDKNSESLQKLFNGNKTIAFKKAKNYTDSAIVINKEIGDLRTLINNYGLLSELLVCLGDHKGALENYKLCSAIKDSLFNIEKNKKLTQQAMQYEFDKKEASAKAEQDKKDSLMAEKNKKQTIIRNSFIGGFALMFLLAVVSYKSYQRKQKDNKIITQQIKVVEEQNREIKDSIQYALRIQTAILPPQRIVKQYLENSFILYKPKDIVAGDFYWMETVQFENENQIDTFSNSQIILFAACDCTGHGVPGAMVSVVCHNALNRAVREFGLTQPAAILDKTAEIVIENFSKSEEDIKDGMDISLCSYNTLTKELQWAGANNPLWIVRNSSPVSENLAEAELIETKADKQPIGMNEDSKPFTNHTFTLSAGDAIYLFTDGFADQFGGDTGDKKLTRKHFKEVLLSIQNKSLTEQGIALDKFITEYRKEIEQIDDILVMGVKV